MTHVRWFARFRRETRAAAMVEFAIVVPVLLLLLLGIIDYGRFFFLWNNLTNAVRDGARIAAVMSPLDAAAVEAAVRSRINDGNALTGGALAITPVGVVPQRTVRVTISNYPFSRASFLPTSPTVIREIRAEFRYEFQ